MNIDIPIPLFQSRRGWTIPLSLNVELNKYERNRRRQNIKTHIAWHARNIATGTNIPPGAIITAQLHYRPGDNRRRDPDNLIATSKPAIDGLVLGRLIPDDNPKHINHLMPQIHPGKGDPFLYLRVTIPTTTHATTTEQH